MAGPAEDEVFAAFETYCLAHLDRRDETVAALDAAQIPELRTAAAEPFLTGLTGRVWTLPGRVRSIVLLTDRGACSVRSPDVDGSAAVALLEAQTKNRPMGTRERPTQVESRYAVTVPEPDGDRHAVVIANVSRLDSVRGVVLDAISEGTLEGQGIPVPRWP